MAKSAKKHGNLNAHASRVYEAIRRDNPKVSKKKAAKIANASYAGTINHKGKRRGKRK